MFEKLDKCPSCGHSKFQNTLICKDYTLSHESFAIVKCENCSLLFTNPRPPLEIISKYYESDEYISHSNKTGNILDFVYKIVRSYSLSKKVKLINNLCKSKSLLDYGCGTGHFLKVAKDNNWDVTGVEPSNIATTNLDDNIKSLVHDNLNKIPSNQYFGIITLWHVLEHVHDLNDTLSLLKNKLEKDGKILIAVPNPNSYDASHFKEHWAAYDVPRHLYHFTRQSMKFLLKQHKLSVVKIVPMKFDSFYVSLLSNKYKYGQSNFINSIITGYKSNTYAKKSGEYSSLIYIVSR